MQTTRHCIQALFLVCCFSSHSLFATRPESHFGSNLGSSPPVYLDEEQDITYNTLLNMAESGDLSAQYTLACDYLEGNSRFPDSLNEPENRYYRYSKSHQYFTNLENYIERIKTISNRDSLHFLSKTVRNGKWESAFCIVYFDVINSVMLVVFFSISKFMGCKQSAEIDGPRKSDQWLRDKNRWLEEVKKTTTNHRNES